MICIYLSLIVAPLLTETHWDRLKPLSTLTQEQLLSQIPEKFSEAKLIVVTKPQKGEAEDQALYEAYWTAQKFKPYPGIYIAADKKLPGQFEVRKWSDKHIVIVEPSTPRDVVFHLLLHFLLPENAERKSLASAVVELQKKSKEEPTPLLEARLKLFKLDIEVLTDIYLLDKSAEFTWTKDELESIKRRIAHQATRLERELAFLKSSAEKLKISTDDAERFLKMLRSKIEKGVE